MEIMGIPVESRKSVTVVMEAEGKQLANPSDAQPVYSQSSGNTASDLNSYFNSMKETHKITVSIGYLASGDMAKIYAASSTGAVRGVIFSVNANMKKIAHSGASEEQIDEVVRKMKRVLSKAQSKLGALKREAALENRRRIAELMQKREVAQQLSGRLKKKRYVRRAREYCEIVDAGDILHSPGSQYGISGELSAGAAAVPLPLGAVAVAPAAAAAAGVQAAGGGAAAPAAAAAGLNVVV